MQTSTALDRAIARIESQTPAVVRRRLILQIKGGARGLIQDPWRLGVRYSQAPLMRRLQAELAHRYFRRFA